MSLILSSGRDSRSVDRVPHVTDLSRIGFNGKFVDLRDCFPFGALVIDACEDFAYTHTRA